MAILDTSLKKRVKTGKIVSAFFIISGVLLIIIWPNLFDHLLFKQLVLRPGNLYHNFWSDPPQPMYLDVYLFNWTNAEDFLNHSIKPKFTEIGPYRFQEFPKKVNVTWNDENSTVSYRKQSRFFFVPEQSKGRLVDSITTVNVVALLAATQARNWNIFKLKGVEMSLSLYGQKLHNTKTADEWLFTGYDDPIISVATDMASILGMGEIPFDRFGWFYQRNDSNILNGHFNAFTGVDDITKVDRLATWEYEPKNKFLTGKCSAFSGSAGEFYPPGIKKEQTVSIFSPEICRSFHLDFEEEKNIFGINTLKFSGGDRTVDNGTLYPENECYCNGECVPSGLFNVSLCKFGTPGFVSFPHFYNADPFYLEQVEGLKPDKDKHQFFISYEPKTGFPIEIAARFQLNLLITPMPRFNMYKNVPRKFIPILWFEQRLQIPADMAYIVKMVLAAPLAGQLLGGIFLTIGVVLMLIFCLNTRDKHISTAKIEQKVKNSAESLPLIKKFRMKQKMRSKTA